MGLLDDIKTKLKQVADRAPELKDEAFEKFKQYSDDGIEITRDLFADISNQVSEITLSTRLQYNIRDMEKELNAAYRKLGELGFTAFLSSKDKGQIDRMFSGPIGEIEKMRSDLNKKKEDFRRYKKEKSDNYIINKFGEELARTGAVIDQAYVSDKSNVNGKLLKDLLLPKEALISAIKRGEDVIIPDGKTQLLSSDLVTVFGKEDDVKKLIKRLTASK
jgi:hypothetical protein